MKILTGLLEPTEGKVLFEGRDIRDSLESYRAAFGYVPEEAYVYTHLSGLEYLQLVGRLRGMLMVVHSKLWLEASVWRLIEVVLAMAMAHLWLRRRYGLRVQENRIVNGFEGGDELFQRLGLRD